MILVSFVIANYNYERFVAQAIESALAQDWPDIEVVVVDDGSSDGSRAVIDSFGDRITRIYQDNAGQRVANNAGFAASRGEIVVFLDSDDTVAPDFTRKVCAVWRPGVSKVQVQMIRIDAKGKPFGRPFPKWPSVPSPDDVRQWAMSTSEYPTPPGSANAYARSFLEQFFPIGPEHDSSTDSTCLVMAPLLGDVITIREPLAAYRRHGSNDSNLLANRKHFARELTRAVSRQKTADQICRSVGKPAPPQDILRHSWYILQLRVASLRSAPDLHPLPGDSRGKAVFDAVRNLGLPSSEPVKKRLKVAAWSIVTLLAPQPLAHRLVRFRFGEKS